MPIQHPAEIGYGYVIERYVTTGRSRSAPLGRYGEILTDACSKYIAADGDMSVKVQSRHPPTSLSYADRPPFADLHAWRRHPFVQ